MLSSGRAWLGIGAGYNRDEASAKGLFLPELAERFTRMMQTLWLAAQMWTVTKPGSAVSIWISKNPSAARDPPRHTRRC